MTMTTAPLAPTATAPLALEAHAKRCVGEINFIDFDGTWDAMPCNAPVNTAIFIWDEAQESMDDYDTVSSLTWQSLCGTCARAWQDEAPQASVYGTYVLAVAPIEYADVIRTAEDPF